MGFLTVTSRTFWLITIWQDKANAISEINLFMMFDLVLFIYKITDNYTDFYLF